MRKIDFGSGIDCKPGFEGVDIKKFNNDVKHVFDLDILPLPFENESVDEIYSSHVMEHLTNPMQTIAEFYRILKPGGKVIIKVPYFAHPGAFKPNHKIFWPMCCKDYFNGDYHEYPKWDKVDFSHVWGQSKIYWPLERICDIIINLSDNFYEKRISRIFPFFELIIELKKEVK